MANRLGAGLKTSVVTLSIFLLPLRALNVDAYIDPGTGSLVIQIVIASLAGAAFLIKVFWIKIKAFLKNLFRSRKG